MSDGNRRKVTLLAPSSNAPDEVTPTTVTLTVTGVHARSKVPIMIHGTPSINEERTLLCTSQHTTGMPKIRGFWKLPTRWF